MLFFKSIKKNMSNLYNYINSLKPITISRARDRSRNTSTRDKARLLRKVQDIEEVLNCLNVKVNITPIEPQEGEGGSK